MDLQEGNEEKVQSDTYDPAEKVCRVCYGSGEESIGEVWAAPCKCSGSIKWIHMTCMQQWVANAPVLQQSKCNTCKFPYKMTWSLKPFKRWGWPSLNLSAWDVVEILLDMYSTVKLVRGTSAMIEGRKSIIGQACYFVFWKIFIFNGRRVEYYKSLFRSAFGAIFEISFLNA